MLRPLATLVFVCSMGLAVAIPGEEDILELDHHTQNVLQLAVDMLNKDQDKSFPLIVSKETAPNHPNAISKVTLMHPQTWNYVSRVLDNQLQVFVDCEVTAPLTRDGVEKAKVMVSLLAIVSGRNGDPKVKIENGAANMQGVREDKQDQVLADIKSAFAKRVLGALADAKQTLDPNDVIFDPDYEEEKEAKKTPPSTPRTCPGDGVGVRLSRMFPKYGGEPGGYAAIPKTLLGLPKNVFTWAPIWAFADTTLMIKGGVECDFKERKLSRVQITFNAIRLYFLGNFGSQSKPLNIFGRKFDFNRSNQKACGGFQDWQIAIGAAGGTDTNRGVNIRITLNVANENKPEEHAVIVRGERRWYLPRKVQVEKVEILSKKLDADDGPKIEGFNKDCKEKYQQKDTVAKILNGEDPKNQEYSLAEQIKKSVEAYIKGAYFPRKRYRDDEVWAILTDH